MKRSVRSAALVMLGLLMTAVLGAQTAFGCDLNQSPPGGSTNFDVSRSFCSVTRRALPIETTLPSTLAHWMGYADVSAFLVVDSHGAVDRRLTRMWSYSGGAFGARGYNMNDSLMAAVARFRFTPAFALDTAVRSALGIDLMTHGAPDSLPATASLRYVVGSRGGDTLWLDWTPQLALPVGAPADIGTAIAAALAELRVTTLFTPYYQRDSLPWTGCSAVGPQIPERDLVEAWLKNAGVPLAPEGTCTPFERQDAVEWTRIFRIAPHVYTVRYVAPVAVAGKCRVEKRGEAWTALCG